MLTGVGDHSPTGPQQGTLKNNRGGVCTIYNTAKHGRGVRGTLYIWAGEWYAYAIRGCIAAAPIASIVCDCLGIMPAFYPLLGPALAGWHGATCPYYWTAQGYASVSYIAAAFRPRPWFCCLGLGAQYCNGAGSLGGIFRRLGPRLMSDSLACCQ